MAGLAVNVRPFANTPEDGWFRWIAVASVVLHGLIVYGFNAGISKTQTTATHSAIRVSLSLLNQQADSRAVVEQKHEKVSRKKKVPFVKKSNNSRHKEKIKPVTAEKRQRKAVSKLQTMDMAPVVSEQVIHGASDASRMVKQRYLSRLLTHVERFKFYPLIARRHGIEGNVAVSFHLLRTGEIRQLKVSSGPLILRQAAEHAIHDALPMPVPPAEVTTPKQLSFVMAYQLQ